MLGQNRTSAELEPPAWMQPVVKICLEKPVIPRYISQSSWACRSGSLSVWSSCWRRPAPRLSGSHCNRNTVRKLKCRMLLWLRGWREAGVQGVSVVGLEADLHLEGTLKGSLPRPCLISLSEAFLPTLGPDGLRSKPVKTQPTRQSHNKISKKKANIQLLPYYTLFVTQSDATLYSEFFYFQKFALFKLFKESKTFSARLLLLLKSNLN